MKLGKNKKPETFKGKKKTSIGKGNLKTSSMNKGKRRSKGLLHV
jgi:hypothetical protein